MVLMATTSATSPLNISVLHIVFAPNVSGSLGNADPRNGITDARFCVGRLVDRKNARRKLYSFLYAR